MTTHKADYTIIASVINSEVRKLSTRLKYDPNISSNAYVNLHSKLDYLETITRIFCKELHKHYPNFKEYKFFAECMDIDGTK